MFLAGYLKTGAALQRADRLSRKLQRRITRRTLLEARALRKDTENTLHTLIFFAETVRRILFNSIFGGYEMLFGLYTFVLQPKC